MKRYIDEDERIWTLEELEKFYNELKEAGDIEEGVYTTFECYMEEATGKNGTLTEI